MFNVNCVKCYTRVSCSFMCVKRNSWKIKNYIRRTKRKIWEEMKKKKKVHMFSNKVFNTSCFLLNWYFFRIKLRISIRTKDSYSEAKDALLSHLFCKIRFKKHLCSNHFTNHSTEHLFFVRLYHFGLWYFYKYISASLFLLFLRNLQQQYHVKERATPINLLCL